MVSDIFWGALIGAGVCSVASRLAAASAFLDASAAACACADTSSTSALAFAFASAAARSSCLVPGVRKARRPVSRPRPAPGVSAAVAAPLGCFAIGVSGTTSCSCDSSFFLRNPMDGILNRPPRLSSCGVAAAAALLLLSSSFFRPPRSRANMPPIFPAALLLLSEPCDAGSTSLFSLRVPNPNIGLIPMPAPKVPAEPADFFACSHSMAFCSSVK